MKLVDLINNKQNVRFDDIPTEYQESYNKFMTGQTIYKDDEGYAVSYYNDFIIWYYANMDELNGFILREERDTKLETLL